MRISRRRRSDADADGHIDLWTNWPDVSGPMVVRALGAAANGQWPYAGYLDEVRILKGVARWTANFTPPSRPY